MLKNLKKSIYMIIFFFIITSIIVVFKNKKNNNLDKNLEKNNIESSENITTIRSINKNKKNNNSKNEYQYILKEFQGKLAVFEKDKKDPEMIFDVSIESLPEVDIIELKKGLKIKNQQELNDRIEDFIS